MTGRARRQQRKRARALRRRESVVQWKPWRLADAMARRMRAAHEAFVDRVVLAGIDPAKVTGPLFAPVSIGYYVAPVPKWRLRRDP